jgi:hypothetical protein
MGALKWFRPLSNREKLIVSSGGYMVAGIVPYVSNGLEFCLCS